MLTATLDQQLVGQVQRRCNRFVTTTIQELFTDSESFLTVDGALVDWLVSYRDELGELLGGQKTDWLIQILAYHMRRFLKNNNQFLRLTDADQQRLATVYRRFLQTMVQVACVEPVLLPEQMRMALFQHRLNLRAFVQSLALFDHGIYRRGPLCHEYSAELQIKILQPGRGTLHGPILDLGCGEHGHLVRALRVHGVDAVGIDICAPLNHSTLIQADWLTYPLGREHWRMIVSHMAFSHHFVHYYLAEDDAIRAYARRFSQILQSLQPGGCFIYAPGLPFIEDVLPTNEFVVTRRPILQMQGTHADQQLARLIGQSTFYRACIQRK